MASTRVSMFAGFARRFSAAYRYLPRVRVIGLMSGTSADGVDAALVEWPDDAEAQPFRLLAFRETAFEADLQGRIHQINQFIAPAFFALRL